MTTEALPFASCDSPEAPGCATAASRLLAAAVMTLWRARSSGRRSGERHYAGVPALSAAGGGDGRCAAARTCP
jgi:hypothetical protein